MVLLPPRQDRRDGVGKMLSKNTSVIVIGSVSIDIIALGVKRIIGPGEATRGKELKIGPGGKAVNASRMIAALTNGGKVGVIGKCVKDPFNLWKVPIDALQGSGVNTDFVQVLSFEKTKKYSSISLRAVDINGNNQIYGLPGIRDSLSRVDIDSASELFHTVGSNKGFLILSVQIPIETATYAIEMANKHGIRVLLDAGGVQPEIDYENILRKDIFLLKPNEHEAKILTGISVTDFESAKKVAEILLKKNIKNILITHGKYGGYLFNDKIALRIPIPLVKSGEVKDETGCGDQTLAGICIALLRGDGIEDACKFGILLGTIQFERAGTNPVTREELKEYEIN